MKKLLFAVCVLCALLLCSAYADMQVETDHFVVNLPGDWDKYTRTYIKRSTILEIHEVKADDDETMDANTDATLERMCNITKAHDDYKYNLRTEPLEVCGKPSTLITFDTGARLKNPDAYVVYTWSDGALLYLVYEDFHADDPLGDLHALLDGIQSKAALAAQLAPYQDAYTVFDQDGIRVIFSNIGIEPGYPWLAVDVTVLNGSDRDIMYSFWDVYLNGWKLDSAIGDSIKAKRNGITTEHWIGMDKIGVSKATDIQSLELTLRLDDTATYETLYEQPVAITFPTQP